MNPLLVDIECVGISDAATYLEPIEAPSNYKNQDAIDKYIAEATARAVDRCALDPDLARIVALGTGDWNGHDHVVICQDEKQEKEALEVLWHRVVNAAGVVHRTLVSFNGFGYDLPVLMRRSQYLGVKHPILSIDRYRSPHLDLMQRLTFNGAIKAHRLRFYASRFGMAVEDPHTGAEIAELVKAGDWSGVESHCLADLAQTRFIAQKLGLIPSLEMVA